MLHTELLYIEIVCEVSRCLSLFYRQEHLQVSLWWRWLAAEGGGEKVPQLWAGVKPEQVLELWSGQELGSQQEK